MTISSPYADSSRRPLVPVCVSFMVRRPRALNGLCPLVLILVGLCLCPAYAQADTPTISAVPTALSNFSAVAGEVSTSQSFALSASNLVGPVNLTVTNGYEISTSTNSGFATNLSVAAPPSTGAYIEVVASDYADNYGTGWTTGANGGTGFGPWVITANVGSGYAGTFIGNPTNAGISTNATFGTNAFGMYANPGASGAYANADRTFPALQVGQTFSFQWGVNWDADVGNKGFNLYAGGTNGAQLVNVNQGGFPGNITVNGSDAVTNYGTYPMTWSFTMTASNNLLVTSTGRDGTTNIVFTTNITASAPPDAFRWYVSAMASGDQRQPYFNNLRIAYIGGNITNLPIYVRIGTNAPVAEATNSLVSRVTIAGSNATDVFVNVSGTVADRPSVAVSTNALADFATTNGMASPSQSFLVSGRNLTNDVVLSATPTNCYQISTNGAAFTNAITLVRSNGIVSPSTIYVRISPAAPVSTNANSLLGSVLISSPSAATNVSLSGRVFEDPTIPVVEVGTNALTGLASVEGSPGSSTNLTVSGRYLRSSILIGAPVNFAVSSNNLDFASFVSLAPDSNRVVSPAPVYVRIAATAPAGSVSGDIVLTSSNLPAPVNVAVSGTVTNWSVANPYGIRVTNPVDPISTNGTNFIFSGQFGTAIGTNTLSWFNLTTSVNSEFNGNSDGTWSASVPLGSGNNTVVFSGQYLTNAGSVTIGLDAPSDGAYAPPGGWSTGSDGGYGFGAWILYSESGLSALYRTDVWASTNMNVAGFYGFALEAIVGARTEAYRPFDSALQQGGAFTVSFDSNDLQPGGSVGMQLVSSNRTPIFAFTAFNDGSGAAYRISDANTAPYTPAGWAYTSAGITLRFEMTSSNTYLVSAVGQSLTNTNAGTISGTPIAGVVFFSDSAGAPPDNSFYIGQMQQSATTYQSVTASTVAPDVERTGSPGSAYDIWAAAYGLDPAGNGAPAADPDKDGFANDMEFAFGTNPTSPTAAMLDTSQAGGNMVVTFLARTANVSYAVMQKANLAANVPSWADTGIVPARSPNQTGVPVDYERRTFSVAASGQNFYRVRATISQ